MSTSTTPSHSSRRGAAVSPWPPAVAATAPTEPTLSHRRRNPASWAPSGKSSTTVCCSTRRYSVPDHTEGYWVADAKLGYRVNSNLDLQLNMYNLFDTDYVASINKSGYRYHPGEPRTFMLTANVHF